MRFPDFDDECRKLEWMREKMEEEEELKRRFGDEFDERYRPTEIVSAHSVLSKVVSSTSSSGVVTVTTLVKGPIGNQIAETDPLIEENHVP